MTEKTIYESPLRKVVLPAILPFRPVDKMNELIKGSFQIISSIGTSSTLVLSWPLMAEMSQRHKHNKAHWTERYKIPNTFLNTIMIIMMTVKLGFNGFNISVCSYISISSPLFNIHFLCEDTVSITTWRGKKGRKTSGRATKRLWASSTKSFKRSSVSGTKCLNHLIWKKKLK